MRLLPRLSASGRGLAIHHHGRLDVPPLIAIRQFAVSGGFIQLLRGHVNHVTVEGLDIMIPPKEQRDHQDDAVQRREAGQAGRSPNEGRWSGDGIDGDRPARKPGCARDDSQSPIRRNCPKSGPSTGSTCARLAISRCRSRRCSRTPVPPGEIATEGTFGPWDREEPGRSPLGGTFWFDRADLSVFKGISGILSSAGSFEGELAQDSTLTVRPTRRTSRSKSAGIPCRCTRPTARRLTAPTATRF